MIYIQFAKCPDLHKYTSIVNDASCRTVEAKPMSILQGLDYRLVYGSSMLFQSLLLPRICRAKGIHQKHSGRSHNQINAHSSLHVEEPIETYLTVCSGNKILG